MATAASALYKMSEGLKPIGERLATLEAKFSAESEKGDDRDQRYTKRLDDILEQTTKTNGRVTTLEGWLNRVKGAWWLLLILAALIGFMLEKIIHFK